MAGLAEAAERAEPEGVVVASVWFESAHTMAQGAADAAGGVASSRCNTIYEHSDGAASDHPSLQASALSQGPSAKRQQ